MQKNKCYNNHQFYSEHYDLSIIDVFFKFIAPVDLKILQIKLDKKLDLTQLESSQLEVYNSGYKNNKITVQIVIWH